MSLLLYREFYRARGRSGYFKKELYFCNAPKNRLSKKQIFHSPLQRIDSPS